MLNSLSIYSSPVFLFILYLQIQDYQKNFRNEKKNPEYTFMLVSLPFFSIQALKAALFWLSLHFDYSSLSHIAYCEVTKWDGK